MIASVSNRWMRWRRRTLGLLSSNRSSRWSVAGWKLSNESSSDPRDTRASPTPSLPEEGRLDRLRLRELTLDLFTVRYHQGLLGGTISRSTTEHQARRWRSPERSERGDTSEGLPGSEWNKLRSVIWIRIARERATADTSGPPGGDLCLDWSLSKGRAGADAIISSLEGILQSYGYAVYDGACSGKAIVQLGCRAHARRRFYEVYRDSELEAARYLLPIRELYAVESEAAQPTPSNSKNSQVNTHQNGHLR